MTDDKPAPRLIPGDFGYLELLTADLAQQFESAAELQRRLREEGQRAVEQALADSGDAK